MMRALLGRLPLAWRVPAVRGLAVVVTASVWLLLVALLIAPHERAILAFEWLLVGASNLNSNDSVLVAFVVASCIVLVFPLAWSRPWTRLARVLGQPLVPRHAEAPLLNHGLTYLRQRNLLCRALAWSAALSLGAWLLTQTPTSDASRLLNTPLEGGSTALGLALAVLVAAFVGGWAQGLPQRWARGRLSGDVPGWVASDGLTLGANLMVVSVLALALVAWRPAVTESPLPVFAESLLVLPSALAWWLCYVMLLHAIAPPTAVSEPLWLAVLPPPADDSNARTDLRTLLALAHHLAGEWRIGPVSVLLPASAHAGGEHLLAAEAAGQRDVLFPTLPVQWRDWQRLQPPAARWSSLPLRELHLPDGAMLAAARELVPPGARLVVLAAPAAADLPAWQALLRDRPGELCRTGPAPIDAAPAATVARSELRARALRAAALRLLEHLRPRAEVADAAMNGDAPAVPAGSVVDLPGILHPGRFALAALATGAFVLLVYAAMAIEIQRAGDEAFTAIRDIAALRSPPAATPPPAAAPATAR